MAFATWNSATAVSVTLSGSDLIATNTGTTSANQGAKGVVTAEQTAGKYYFEATFTTLAGGNNYGIGVGQPASLFNTMGGFATIGCMLFRSGNIWANGSNTGVSLSARSNGNVVGVAVDLDNRTIWFRVAPAGNWNNSGTANPATNSGGIAVPSGSIVPFCTFGGTSGVASNILTANFGASSFTGTVPSGFIAGWLAGPPNVDLAGNLGGVSQYGRLKYGLKHYSRVDAFAPLLAADLTVVAALNLAGGLTPTIVLAADLDVHVNLISLRGDLAPQIALEGALSLLVPLDALEGSFGFEVVYGASSFISGPLWADSEPCPPPLWAESEPCPPPAWMISPPSEPVVWSKTRLCNG